MIEKGNAMKNQTCLRTFQFALIAFLAFFCTHCFAQGFILPPPNSNVKFSQLNLTQHDVRAEIRNQAAQVEVSQEFYNSSNRTVEGTYYFPLPKGSAVSDFKMYLDGKVLSGELLDKEKARKIYEDIVRRNIDPALLEYIDYRLFSAKIFPIPPKKKRKIVLKYSSLLEQEGGLIKFIYPLRGDVGEGRSAFNPRRLPPEPPRILPLRSNKEELRKKKYQTTPVSQNIIVTIESEIPIKNIYSPSHKVDVSRPDDNHAEISYEGTRNKPEGNFVLYYAYSKEDFGISLLSYKNNNDDDGYFLLLLSPKVNFKQQEILKKDILFILDTSGSMSGEKIEQAKAALKYCLNHLNKQDRFTIISFSSGVRQFSEELVPVSKNRERALRYVDEMDAAGGTNINEALLKALEIANTSNRPVSMVFLTDGLPTVGERDEGKIIKNVSDQNKKQVKIFTFGVGYDVNTYLLDKIASDNNAVSDYIEPDENIELVISEFYNKISNPVLTELSLEFKNIPVDEIYPKKLPDLFKGTQLTVLGRYKKDGKGTVYLKGKASKKLVHLNYSVTFNSNSGNDFLPKLWAMRKIGFLYDEIRLYGSNEELITEIRRLSKKYGIMSPYTSFLVTEEKKGYANVDGLIQKDNFDIAGYSMSLEAASNVPMTNANLPQGVDNSIKAQIKLSKKIRSMREAQITPIRQNVFRNIQGRSFYRKDGFWIDTEYHEEKTINIKYRSKAYIKLVTSSPKFARFAALGKQVIFKFKGKYIKIGINVKENLSRKEWKLLLE